jgi:hypothetical protein
MGEIPLLWNGTLVGWLKQVETETVAGRPGKVEGDFVCAEGPVAAEFRSRLEGHETLEVRRADSDALALCYGRRGGRAKLAW